MPTTLARESETEPLLHHCEPAFELDETDDELVLKVEILGSHPRRFVSIHVPKEGPPEEHPPVPAEHILGFHADATPC